MKVLSAGFACLLAAAILTVAAGCSDKGKIGAAGEQHPLVRGATLETAAFVSVTERFEATGTVRARNSAVLSARIAGIVSGTHVKQGDRVARGRLLLTLDAPESLAGSAGAAFAVEEAQRAVDESLARNKLAGVTYERFAQLYQEQAATRQELDTHRAERDMAEQGLARSRARLAQVREAARSAGAIAGYTRITAPISGLVTVRPVDTGSTVFPGSPLLTIEEEGSLRLEVSVPETLLGKIRQGESVPVLLGGAAGTSSGTVVEIVPQVDPVSRTFMVKLDIPSKGVRSGVFGRALFPVGEKKGLLVAESAVMERGELTSVWVVDKQNIARLRLVKPGRTIGNRVEILAGLVAGERVVTGMVEKIVDGAKVE
jgi:multidrug efflux system membrane fusion protein